jgi:hypothetical protein
MATHVALKAATRARRPAAPASPGRGSKDHLPLHRHRLAGKLTEIRASDLAFTVAEAGELMARHGATLTAATLECLTRRTEGWAAGLRLPAISKSTHPDPEQFVAELITEDSTLTGSHRRGHVVQWLRGPVGAIRGRCRHPNPAPWWWFAAGQAGTGRLVVFVTFVGVPATG